MQHVQSIEAANQVLKYGVERIYPTGFLRYVTEVCHDLIERLTRSELLPSLNTSM